MNANQKGSIRRLMRASWEATVNERPRFLAFMILYVIASIINLLVVWAIGYILGLFVEGGFSKEALHKAAIGILLYAGLRLLNTLLHHIARYLQNTVAYSARMFMMTRMFNAFLTFPLRWHLHRHSGENLSKLHRSVGAVDHMIGTYVWQVAEGFVKVILAGVAIIALDRLVALNVLGMCVVTLIAMIAFNKRLVSFIRENNAFYDKLNRTAVDYLFNIVSVKTLRLEKAGQDYFSAHQPTGLSVSKRISKFQELKWGTVAVGYSLVISTSLWIYLSGQSGVSTAFDVARVYVLMNYLDQIFQAIGSFTGYYSAILEGATAFEDGDKILREVADLPAKSRSARAPREWRSMDLKDLAFTYGLELGSGIRGLSLHIKRSEKIALVGPSGGGKSTLLKIMGGMIVPERCEVAFDGVDGFEIDDVAAITLLIPQEPEIFTETVRYNLTFGQPFSAEEMQFYVALCKVEAVIAKLPGGWDNFLAEKGLNLSVGEKQRVALARGLLRAKDRDIMLLDEPTSSIDPLTEKEIFFGLLDHFKDRTIITACHRLSLVPLFDKVIYVRNGLIEELGTFQELLDKDGSFAKAWNDYQQKVVKKITV